MAYIDHFSDNYQETMAKIEQRRSALIEKAKSYTPNNLDEQLKSSEDGAVDQELGWVDISDPRDEHRPFGFEVLPIVGYWRGDEEEGIAPGMSSLTLIGKLPSGQERVIGTLSCIGNYTPTLSLNMDETHNMATEPVRWDSADAEIFLKLVESAFYMLSDEDEEIIFD
jgi:hypothetical protein